MDDRSNVFVRVAGTGPDRYSRIALASFISAVLTMLGLLFGRLAPPIVYLFLCFVPAIVTGHLARREFRLKPGRFRNESMATFGLTVGYLGLFLTIFIVAAIVFGIATFRAA